VAIQRGGLPMDRLITFKNIIIVVISCFLLFLTACTPKQALDDGLVLKTKQNVLTASIDASAATFDVLINNQASKLVIDANTVDHQTEVQVSTTEIKSSSFDIPIEPVTPMISVEVSEPLNKAMKVQIPVEKKDNHTITAVSYNINTQLLEVMESYFTEDELFEVLIDATIDFFITSVAEDLVLATIDTGFRPTVDGFQISNIDTYWQPLGMCSGMTRASMFYYLYLKETHGSLYNRFRETTGLYDFETPDFVNDDVNVIKLNAHMQDSDFASNYRSKYEAIMNDPDDKHFYRMAYHMLISNKPQIIHVQNGRFDPNQPSKPIQSHALIVYRIVANHAYVYDPNFPQNESLKIELDTSTGKLKPYEGLSSVQSEQVVFNTMLYYPLVDVLNIPVSQTIWNKFLTNDPLVSMPTYSFVEVDVAFDGVERFLPISKHYVTNKPSIVVQLNAPSDSYVKVYNKELTYIALSDENQRFTLYLNNDDNYIGFEIFLPIPNHANKKVFSGFEWVNIQRKDFEPWSITSTINRVNSNYYTQQEIDSILNRVIESNILMLYSEENKEYSIYSLENGENFTMTRDGNHVFYEIVRPTDNDTLITTFEGYVTDDENIIMGTNVISLGSKGWMYAMDVKMIKDD
jgi:hypothetical protein